MIWYEPLLRSLQNARSSTAAVAVCQRTCLLHGKIHALIFKLNSNIILELPGSMSASLQHYRTQTMPAFVSSAAASEGASSAPGLTFSLATACTDERSLLDRRASCASCSTSNSSRSWQVGRTRFRPRLPFARVSAQQAGEQYVI